MTSLPALGLGRRLPPNNLHFAARLVLFVCVFPQRSLLFRPQGGVAEVRPLQIQSLGIFHV